MSRQPLKILLETLALASGLGLTSEHLAAFDRYAELLRDWNTRINLTAIVDDEGIVVRHYLDSLSILPVIDRERARIAPRTLNLIDVGSGAGFPGLPVRIVRPDLSVTLLDSLQKRIAFLDMVISELALNGVRTLKSRAEDAGLDPQNREQYDIATARAVASLPVLAEYTLPFVRIGGLMIAMKGQKQEEIDQSTPAVRTLGGQIETVDSFTLPGSDMTRTLVLIRKTAPTPARFPRKAGLPERRPLT